MRRIKFIFLLLLTMFITSCNFLPDLEPEVQDVDYTNVIEIYTVEELKLMEMNKSYQLMNDLDLDGEEWTPIGTLREPFLGHFKGNGFTISNYQITTNHLGFNGLFGYIEGDVEFLNITNFVIDITDDFVVNAGGLAGMSLGSINHVEVDGVIRISVDGFNVYAGMLVGNQHKLSQKTILASTFSPNEVSFNQVSGTIDVSKSEIAYVGGLLGKSHNTKSFNNVVNGLEINVINYKTAFVGGLIGQQFIYDFQRDNPSLSIDYSIVYQNVIDTTMNLGEGDYLRFGGLIGYSQNADINDNFVVITLDIDHHQFVAGLLVGENWLRQINQNLVILKQASIKDGTEYKLSTVVGKNHQEQTLLTHYVVEDATIFTALQGEEKSGEDINLSTYFNDYYGEILPSWIDIIKTVLGDY